MHNDQLQVIMGKDLNLCTYFILPLIELNKFSFSTEDNFVDSYINMQTKQIVVELLQGDFLIQNTLRHPNFVTYYERNGHCFMVYSIPELFHAELRLYTEGKYSRFKEVAKGLIREYSGLGYNQIIDGREASDIRLLALDKSPVLRKAMAFEFQANFDPVDELLAKPGEKSFI